MNGEEHRADRDGEAGALHRIGSFAASVGRQGPKRRWLRLTIEGGLAALIFGFLVVTVVTQWSEIREQGIEFNPVWVLPGIVTIGLYYLGSAAVWGRILGLLGSRVGAGETQRIWAIPLLVRYIPGSVLFLLARILMAERAGAPRRVTTAGIVYEQAVSVSGALTLATYFLIAHPDLGGVWIRWAVLAVIPILVTLLHPRIFGPVSTKLLNSLGREALPRTIGFGQVLSLYGIYVLLWGVMGLGVFMVARSVYFLDLGDLPYVAASQTIGFLAAVVSAVVPAGLGVRDTAFAWAVKATLPSGSFALGAALAIAVRAAQTLTELLYVGAVTTLTPKQKQEKREVGDPEEREG